MVDTIAIHISQQQLTQKTSEECLNHVVTSYSECIQSSMSCYSNNYICALNCEHTAIEDYLIVHTDVCIITSILLIFFWKPIFFSMSLSVDVQELLELIIFKLTHCFLLSLCVQSLSLPSNAWCIALSIVIQSAIIILNYQLHLRRLIHVTLLPQPQDSDSHCKTNNTSTN